MITTPDRMSGAIAAIERGETVDWQQLRTLSALDLVMAGRRFVEQAILRDEQFDTVLFDPTRAAELVLPEFAPAEADPTSVSTEFGVRLPATVLNVHDGDTVRVNIGGLAVDVRLLDCWTAELDEPGGPAAREALAAMIPVGSQVTVWVPAPNARRDGMVHLSDLLTFGRVLGRVLMSGKDVGAALVASGVATVVKPASVPGANASGSVNSSSNATPTQTVGVS
jgi:endonuclease YncB( thermonuclease family)